MSIPLDNVARQAAEWLRGSGPSHEIVISTRIRLARNVRSFPFLARADAAVRAELADVLRKALRAAGVFAKGHDLDVDRLDELDRRLLVERQIISRQHADGSGPRRVMFDATGGCSVMINEEDHLRLQVMRSGMQLDEAWMAIDALDNAIDTRVEYSFHEQYGYLTACPTNVGTGIRVSVMLHLPALRLTGELERVWTFAKELKLAVRGLFGEGTEALGDFFQVSNQITLGRSEPEIIDEFRDEVIPKVVAYEKAARESLLAKNLSALDDKVFRAMGALQNARLISSNEALQCLSHVRMGLHVGRLSNVRLDTVNELFLQTQPAHLQKLQGERLSGEQRGLARAALIRAKLSKN